MPTGYTEFIEDGRITNAKDFLLLCTRAFAIMIDSRDEPLSIPIKTEFKPDTEHYKKWLADTIAQRDELLAMSMAEFHEKLIQDRNKRIENAKESYLCQCKLDEKYELIYREILAWEAPSGCGNLKDFALEQISISRPDLKWYADNIAKAGRLDTDEKEYAALLQCFDRSIAYYKDKIRERQEYIAEKAKFMKTLFESFEQFNKKET